jgi:hypothetical protein
MNLEKLQELHQARPFRPFVIHTADGRIFPIPHNEFLAFHPEGDTLVAYQSHGGLSILDLALITELELLPANGKSNGRAKKPRK